MATDHRSSLIRLPDAVSTTVLDSVATMRDNGPMNTTTLASLLKITNTEDGLVRGTLGALKKTVAFMGFDCATRYQDEMTFVTVTNDGTVVARMAAIAGEAAMMWTSV